MCGRFAAGEPRPDAAEWFDIRESGLRQIAPRYNIAPGAQVVVVRHGEGGREAVVLRWGLRRGGQVPYIRSDNADKSWVRSLLRSRCVIPAAGFYEWQAPAVPRGRKQPYYVSPGEAPMFAFAAVVADWDDPGVALFTTEANEDLEHVHSRMPVLLDRESIGWWLDPRRPVVELRALLRPAPAGTIRSWPVSLAVNNSRNDVAALVEPLAGEGAAGLGGAGLQRG